MSNNTLEKQIDTTVKLLVVLLTEPRLKSHQIAKALGVSQNHVAQMIGRFRDAGVDIEYDHEDRLYVGKFADQLSESILGGFAKKLKKIVEESLVVQPPVRFISTLEQYTVTEFAKAHGMSPANVYNGIAGYKGQSLPTGWVAYQMAEKGRWMLRRMNVTPAGKDVVPPEIIKNAFTYVTGAGEAVRPVKKKAPGCLVGPECDEPVYAKGFCKPHYYQARAAAKK